MENGKVHQAVIDHTLFIVFVGFLWDFIGVLWFSRVPEKNDDVAR